MIVANRELKQTNGTLMAEGKNNLVANQHIVPESRESIITTAIKKTKQNKKTWKSEKKNMHV